MGRPCAALMISPGAVIGLAIAATCGLWPDRWAVTCARSEGGSAGGAGTPASLGREGPALKAKRSEEQRRRRSQLEATVAGPSGLGAK